LEAVKSINSAPEFRPFGEPEVQTGVIHQFGDEFTEIAIIYPDSTDVRGFDTKLLQAAGMKEGDHLGFTFTKQVRYGEVLARMNVQNEGQAQEGELADFGTPTVKHGEIHNIEADYAPVCIDGEREPEYFEPDIIRAAEMWAGDKVTITFTTKVCPGEIQVDMVVEGEIKTPEEREVKLAKDAQEAQEILKGVDLEAIGKTFGHHMEDEK